MKPDSLLQPVQAPVVVRCTQSDRTNSPSIIIWRRRMDETPISVAAVLRFELNGTAGAAIASIRRRDRRRIGRGMIRGVGMN